MRILVLFGVALASLCGYANAADLPVKAKPSPVAPASVPNWTGFYAGANLGYGWGRFNSDFFIPEITFDNTSTGSGAVDTNGVIGGVQFGYNWQLSNWLLGVEADFQGSGQRGSGSAVSCPAAICFLTNTTSQNDRIDWFATFRGRAGYVFNNVAIYGTGGGAYAKLHGDGAIANLLGATPFSYDRSQWGWAAGAGLEGMLVAKWSWRLEYLYIALGKFNVLAPPGALGNTDVNVTDSIVRFALNYHL